ncbi:hypothetical protein E4T47_00357 [Aureobasidium subglaciale]|nr:hypothetical protein E4T47_00357 [Aureobasidium subglaciale]
MSSRPDAVRLLEPQLSQCMSLDWLVLGKSAYTPFDREYLGQPSRHNRADQGLRLWIGSDEDTNKLIVALTQEIQVSNGKKPRIYYLCVPVESLAIEIAEPAYWAMSDGVVPLHILDRPNNTRSDQASRLLRMSVSLTAKSWVIMPNFPHTGRVSEMSMSLLSKLKGLSEALSFDLFTTHDSWIYQRLLRVENVLHNGTVTGFNINHATFYPGGRAAVIDLWESQGWCPVEQAIEHEGQLCQPTSSLKRKHDEIATIEPKPNPLPPPPYGIDEPGPKAASTASFDMAALLDHERVESGTDSLLSEIYPRGRSVSLPAKNKKICKPLSPNFVFTPLARHSAHGSDNASRLYKKTLPSYSSPETPQPSRKPTINDSSHTSPLRKETLSLYSSLQVPQTPEEATKIQRFAYHATNDSNISSLPKSTSNFTKTLSTHYLPLNKITVSVDQHTNDQNVLIYWLATLFTRYPYIHYTCIGELLALSSAIDEGPNAIRHARAKCLTAILSCADQQEINSAHDEVEDLISWLLILNPETGDLEFLGQLAELSTAHKRVEELKGVPASPRSSDGALFDTSGCPDRSDYDGEYLQRRHDFMNCKAIIVLDACIRFGPDLERQGRDVKDCMMEEYGHIYKSY